MIATAQCTEQTLTGSLRGSIRWMAAEFLRSGEAQYRHTMEADVWAFGMTIYVRNHVHLSEEDGLTEE